MKLRRQEATVKKVWNDSNNQTEPGPVEPDCKLDEWKCSGIRILKEANDGSATEGKEEAGGKDIEYNPTEGACQKATNRPTPEERNVTTPGLTPTLRKKFHHWNKDPNDE